MMMVVMMVMVTIMTSRPDPHSDAVMMMVMADHNLGGPGASVLG